MIANARQYVFHVWVDVERRHASNDLLRAKGSPEIVRDGTAMAQNLLGVELAKGIFIARVGKPGIEHPIDTGIVSVLRDAAPDCAWNHEITLDLAPIPDHELESRSLRSRALGAAAGWDVRLGVRLDLGTAIETQRIVSIEDANAPGCADLARGRVLDQTPE
jgi:hypothetical protein